MEKEVKVRCDELVEKEAVRLERVRRRRDEADEVGR